MLILLYFLMFDKNKILKTNNLILNTIKQLYLKLTLLNNFI